MTNGSSDTDNEDEIENEGKPELVETELEEIVVEKPVSKSLSSYILFDNGSLSDKYFGCALCTVFSANWSASNVCAHA